MSVKEWFKEKFEDEEDSYDTLEKKKEENRK